MGSEIKDGLDLEKILDTARRAADGAARIALRYFKGTIPVETKPDGSPVTVADKECDAAIIAEIRAAFPGHAILTEESGLVGDPGNPFRWIVDPIDWTKQFLEWKPVWAPLVALAYAVKIVAGAIRLPAIGQEWWAARGIGAFRDGSRLAVARTRRGADARVVYRWRKALWEQPEGAALLALRDSARLAEYVEGLAAPLELIEGKADAWLDMGSKIWDLAAPRILLAEAGGRLTRYDGSESLGKGNVVATNGHLHAHVLAALRSIV